MNITAKLADFISSTRPSLVPNVVKERTEALLIDFAASAIRASADCNSSNVIMRMIERLGLSGDGPCTVFGIDRKFGPGAAALLNGAFGHSLDFDDTHSASSLHPSAPVIPAALSAAELIDASGDELLASIAIGFEVCCRIGVALDPTAHYARGFHPTATAGIFGAAAASSHILGLTAEQTESAFGVAASQSSGSLQFLQNGAWNKRYQVGEASMKGLIAASLAHEGFVGAQDALSGKHGFLKAYSDNPQGSLAIADLGTVWETLKIGVKPYPACRYTHAALDGLINLCQTHHIRSDDISRIVVGLHKNGVALVGTPLEAKRRARTVVEGQFSMPFAAAVVLQRLDFAWDDYELLGRPETDKISDKIWVRREPELEGLSHPFGARLEVEALGQVHKLTIAEPSGEPDSFPSPERGAAKFRTLTAPVLSTSRFDWLLHLRALRQAKSVREHLRVH